MISIASLFLNSVTLLLGLNFGLIESVSAHQRSSAATAEISCVGGQKTRTHIRSRDLQGGSDPSIYDGFAIVPTELGRVAFSISPNEQGYHFLIRHMTTGQTFLDHSSRPLMGLHEVKINNELILFIECKEPLSLE